ncbi:GlxA family transcriptional regulator [Halomonas organivorans]|uniref:Transcriptional regulator GlxA family with amidase domain n=1 Tax=Halomonas organivorans TaxID=257772 RepID=A0A7W5G4D0_9GAMM|nr:GlxA family transcriptional regulator [Halomonas organivorans]MBB3139221.1 transcriptional regulator GlxA family with amidase domain [Halomonas organivorans]
MMIAGKNMNNGFGFSSPLASKNRPFVDLEVGEGVGVEKRRFAFILFENFSLMAFTGALDALVTANLVRSNIIYEFSVVSAADVGGKVVSDLGIEVAVDYSLEDLEEDTFDYLILCGGYRLEMCSPPRLRAKLKTADHVGCVLGGLWNGSYFIAEAGLLEGYECAFHPDGRAMMSEEFPGVKISQQSYVVDRDRVSCAGANSSLDMMLSILSRDCDGACISAIEEVLSCDKKSDVIDISAISIDRNNLLPKSLKSALELMRNNIDEPLSVEELADCVGISRRQLERLFGSHLDTSPSRYYLELRLTQARQLLQHTNKTLADIAVATGFVNISHFRRCFSQLFGVSPGRFRKNLPQSP